MADDLFRVRLHEAIAEIERELQLRETFYPDRVRSGRMSRLSADRQINRLRAARDFLIELRELHGPDHEAQNPAGWKWTSTA